MPAHYDGHVIHISAPRYDRDILEGLRQYTGWGSDCVIYDLDDLDCALQTIADNEDEVPECLNRAEYHRAQNDEIAYFIFTR